MKDDLEKARQDHLDAHRGDSGSKPGRPSHVERQRRDHLGALKRDDEWSDKAREAAAKARKLHEGSHQKTYISSTTKPSEGAPPHKSYISPPPPPPVKRAKKEKPAAGWTKGYVPLEYKEARASLKKEKK